MSGAVPDEINIDEEFHDPDKHIHASFCILITDNMYDLLENLKIVVIS